MLIWLCLVGRMPKAPRGPEQTSSEATLLQHYRAGVFGTCDPEIFSITEEEWNPSLGNYLGEHSSELPLGYHIEDLFLQTPSIIALKHDGLKIMIPH